MEWAYRGCRNFYVEVSSGQIHLKLIQYILFAMNLPEGSEGVKALIQCVIPKVQGMGMKKICHLSTSHVDYRGRHV